jgi:hypothetical protein
MQKWEYLVLSVASTDYDEIEDSLNNLGSQGWEVISFHPTGAYHAIYLKRPK